MILYLSLTHVKYYPQPNIRIEKQQRIQYIYMIGQLYIIDILITSKKKCTCILSVVGTIII